MGVGLGGILGILGGGGSQTGDEGGIGNSKSYSTTQNTDKRQVLEGAGGVGISSDQSTVTFQQTDQGAIAGALDLAKSSSDTAYKGLTALLGLHKDIVSLEGQTATHIQDAYSGVTAAYQGATDSASGVRVIALSALVIGALVVTLIIWKAR